MAKRGRPPKAQAERKNARLDLRLAPEEKEVFQRAASEEGVELSVWVRMRLWQAVREDGDVDTIPVASKQEPDS